jgi:hypothetical protein
MPLERGLQLFPANRIRRQIMCDTKEDEGRKAPGGDSGAAAHAATGGINAYDIPRYNAQGNVQGRPQTPNDPLSAGKVYGAPSNGATAGHPGEAAPAQGMMHAGDNQAYGPMPGDAFAGYPGGPVPPQGMVYGGGGPAYAQMPAGGPAGYYYGGPAPPQAMVYGGGGPAYVQMPAGGPAGYYYGGPVPPQAMVYGPAAPGAAAGYPGTPAPGTGGFSAAPGAADGASERIAAMVRDMANGKPPDVDKMVTLFNGFDTQFWKGALIGAVVAVLVTSETVRSGVAGAVGGIFSQFKTDGGSKDPKPDAP